MGRRQADQRSPLTTTAAAAGGAVVLALVLGPVASAATSAASHEVTKARRAAAATAGGRTAGRSEALRLADTGSVDTTPYLVGGCSFLVLGGALVVTARRRESAAG